MMFAVPLTFRKSKTHQEIRPFLENNKNCIKDSIFKFKKIEILIFCKSPE